MNSQRIVSINVGKFQIVKRSRFDIVNILYYLSIFTVSFDVFLIVNLGFNFRATQLLALFPIFIGITGTLHKENIAIPVGFKSLLIWTLFILAFIPNTTFLLKSVGYGFWLLFDVSLVLATVQIFNTENKINSLITWYLYSFFFVAIFGLVQFIMPILHLGAPLVQQWWVPGVLPRISGFSYESSFFSTYMLLGWVLSAYLLNSGFTLVNQSRLKIIFMTISLVMILSSSRMGWLMMLVWFVQYPIRFLFNLAKGRINKKLFVHSGRIVLLLLLLVIGGIWIIGMDNIPTLFLGLGLFEESGSWSADTRLNSFHDTLQVFLDSPLIGHSLGGVSSAIGALHGVYVDNIDLGKEYEGNSIFVEVLAASGLIGFIPFVSYIYAILRKPLKLAKLVDNSGRNLLIGMTLALLFEFVILQFNQVILRPYLWLHIAILSALYSVYSKKRFVRNTVDAKEAII